MMITKAFIDQLNRSITVEGQSTIVEFFITFSRFECALKASEFLQGDNDRVSANWDTFIAHIRPNFDKNQSAELRTAFDYILNHPPRIQMINNNALGWRNRIFQDNEPEINRVSLSIRDIRNNLFHGGKFHGNFQADVARNHRLLSSSLAVLNSWLQLSDQVRTSFLDPIH